MMLGSLKPSEVPRDHLGFAQFGTTASTTCTWPPGPAWLGLMPDLMPQRLCKHRP